MIMAYKNKAVRRWRQAVWITGNGRYALLAHCDVLTITLWDTLEAAINSKEAIDNYACGHACYKNHEIIDLNKKRSQGKQPLF